MMQRPDELSGKTIDPDVIRRLRDGHPLIVWRDLDIVNRTRTRCLLCLDREQCDQRQGHASIVIPCAPWLDVLRRAILLECS